MIRKTVGWLMDEPSYVGGAELTQAEFRAAAPDSVEIVDCPAGSVNRDCDAYAIHNCVQYTIEDLDVITRQPTVKYHNDVGPWLEAEVRDLLDRHATPICCSPLQAEYMGLDDAILIPPPVELERFEHAAENTNGNRAGAVSVGSWRNFGKAAHRVAAWGAANGGVDFYGDGPFAPQDAQPVPYEQMPSLLAGYRTFVFLPQVIEPFGRLVAEAWAAGCELVVNDLVGAKWWITERPERLKTAAQDFWEVLLNA